MDMNAERTSKEDKQIKFIAHYFLFFAHTCTRKKRHTQREKDVNTRKCCNKIVRLTGFVVVKAA